MAFPNPQETLNLLGYMARDKITGIKGIVTAVYFDLYGCVQATLHSGLDKDGKPREQFYYDIQRLEIDKTKRIMTPPPVSTSAPETYNFGSAEKPKVRAI